MSPIHFIKQLSIDKPPKSLARGITSIDSNQAEIIRPLNNHQSAFVNVGSLVTFESGVTTAHQEDFLNSILIAQLAADKKFNRYTQVRDWYNFYSNVLSNIGWPTAGFELTKYDSGGSQVEVDKVIIQVLSALAGGVPSAALLATIKALGDLPGDDKRFALFRERSQNLDSANFQIARLCKTNGVLQVNLGAVHFKSSQREVRFLWFSFDSLKIELYKGGQNILFNEGVYARVREAIKTKLGDNAIIFVKSIEI